MQLLPSKFRLISMVSLFLVLAACCDSSDNKGDRSETAGLADASRQAELAVGVAVNDDASSEQRAIVSREFTSVTAENAMKWQSLAPTSDSFNFSNADQLVDSGVANGQRVRGHTLFWHRLNGLPPWLTEELDKARDPAARLQELMVTHTDTVVGRYAGQLAQWDVINEPLAIAGGDFDPENIFYQLLGEQYLDIALLQAHTADPSAELFINETFIEFSPIKFDALIALAQRLLDRGIPLHGLGLQGHFVFRAPDKDILRDQLQRIAALGLKAEITELDIPLPLFSDTPDPLAAQAQAYADVFQACLAVTLCSGITVWGIDDAHTWLDSFFSASAPNRPLLFDAMLQPKPAYDSVVKTLLTMPR